MLISIKAVLLQHLFVWVLFVAVFGRGLEERRGSFVPSLFFLCRIESGTGKLVHTHSVCCQRREKGRGPPGNRKKRGEEAEKSFREREAAVLGLCWRHIPKISPRNTLQGAFVLYTVPNVGNQASTHTAHVLHRGESERA